MNEKQHTLKSPVSVSGVGLHTGAKVRMTFMPAPEGHGIVFYRTDLEGSPGVPADVDFVVDTSRGTTLGKNDVRVHTVEHTLAALSGMQLDNVRVELEGPEPPIMDGSSIRFVEALRDAGLVEQEAKREIYELREAVRVEDPERKVSLEVVPANEFSATVHIDFDSNVLGPQSAHLGHLEKFGDDFADSRTFCFLHEVEPLLNSGLIKGGDLDNAIVLVDREIPDAQMEHLCQLFNKPRMKVKKGVLNHIGLRHQNEPARHKLLDLVGDLSLVGVPFKGKVIASRPGHKANIELARKIKAHLNQNQLKRKYQTVEKEGVIFDINAIQKILPHRYPFLLVDKITEFSDEAISGIKNVTINEPFFSGHFEGNPIMPGVLQLEAMAQVGGILLLNQVDNLNDYWIYFVAIDNAKFKKPVIPGDTLTFQVRLTGKKRNIYKVTGQGFVDGKLVVSADLTASIVPKNPK
jgi:UDP-3-O-[3-hydroxymyristoyl] N-acetylglucosamine deacetylase/3-hydroxyacyl-[acyl-carrier-protein] dehydratase